MRTLDYHGCLALTWSRNLLILVVTFVSEAQELESAGAAVRFSTLTGNPSELYAHRGEATLAPGNTLPAFELAVVLQADFIEPDLQLTQDGILVCHHDLGLNKTTEVAFREEFRHLRSTLSYKTRGLEHVGMLASDEDDWFIKDFTVAQLKTLKVKEDSGGIRPHIFNLEAEIPTFAEYLALTHQMSARLNRRLGIIPELKVPKFHDSLPGRPHHYMEDEFLRIMAEFGYSTKSVSASHCVGTSDTGSGDSESIRIECPRVRVQSFETDALTYLQRHSDFETVLAVYSPDSALQYLTLDGIKKVANHGIKELAVWKEFLSDGDGATAIDKLTSRIDPSTLPRICHEHGLRLSIFTIKDSHEEDGVSGMSKEQEMEYFMDLGVDAMFVENVVESREIRTKYECAHTSGL